MANNNANNTKNNTKNNTNNNIKNNTKKNTKKNTKNNLYKLFYKEYYKEVDFKKVLFDKSDEKIGPINDTIKSSTLESIPYPIEGMNTFRMKVLYPGLITGVGLVHDSKGIEGGYNLGMHFDYTHGMPIIYGSTVKGVLKEYFKEFTKGSTKLSKEKLEKLPEEEQLFEGKRKNDKNETENIPIYERDVFFDAVIVSGPKNNGTGGFLEDDYITPHKDPLSNPTPIKMLKIAAGTIIEFRFKLNGSNEEKEAKLDLFKEILTTVGIGAKTNVGYGQLKETE